MIQKETQVISKNSYFEPTFQISKYTDEKLQFLKMFSFQHSQIIQQEFEQLADFFSKIYHGLCHIEF